MRHAAPPSNVSEPVDMETMMSTRDGITAARAGGRGVVASGLPVGLRGASQPGGVGPECEYLRSHRVLSVPSDSCHDDGTG